MLEGKQPPYVVKITDFGLSSVSACSSSMVTRCESVSTQVIVERNHDYHKLAGSPLYMAPEIFSRDHHHDEKAPELPD